MPPSIFALIHIIATCIALGILIEIILFCGRLGWIGLKELCKKCTVSAPNFPASEDLAPKILIIGDSTATGSGVEPLDSIAGHLARTYGASVRNLGQNGARLRDVMFQIDAIGEEKFDLVLIMAGNNDVVRFTPLDKIQADLPSLFEKAKKIGRHVIMLRGGNMGNFPFFPVSIHWIISRRSRQVREICMKIAEEKDVLYVELFMSRKDDIFLKDPSYYYTPDLIHLSGHGYTIWFEHLLKEITAKKYDIFEQIRNTR